MTDNLTALTIESLPEGGFLVRDAFDFRKGNSGLSTGEPLSAHANLDGALNFVETKLAPQDRSPAIRPATAGICGVPLVTAGDWRKMYDLTLADGEVCIRRASNFFVHGRRGIGENTYLDRESKRIVDAVAWRPIAKEK